MLLSASCIALKWAIPATSATFLRIQAFALLNTSSACKQAPY